MKKLILAISLVVSTVDCGYVTVQQGYEAVLIEKPMIFGSGGIDPTPVKTGRVLVAATTSDTLVSMLPFTFDEKFDDIMPKDNNPVDYHAAVRLRVTDSVKLISKYGTDWQYGEAGKAAGYPAWYTSNIQRPFQTMNRNQVRQYSMPDLALQQAVVVEVEKHLKEELTAYIANLGLPVEVQDITLGRISPAKEIIDAYNQTGVQQQRAKTEFQRAAAEVARKDAEGKRAEADRAYQQTLGISADQYIKLQEINMCANKQNCSVFLGATPVPIVGR